MSKIIQFQQILTNFYSQNVSFAGEDLNLIEAREDASSILINPSTLWITGGKHFITGIPFAVTSASTEILSLSPDIPAANGPDLPIHVWGHCLFSNDMGTAAILTGGVSNEHYSSARSYMFDFAATAWTEVIALCPSKIEIFFLLV